MDKFLLKLTSKYRSQTNVILLDENLERKNFLKAEITLDQTSEVWYTCIYYLALPTF